MAVLDYQVPASVATVQRNVKRKPIVAGAVASINAYVDQRIGQAADNLSKGAIIKSRLVLVNQALGDLVGLLFEVDESGHLVNVDPVDGRILVALPWAAGGWKKWKLRQWEGRHLRRIFDRRMRGGERVAMFVYSGESNRWHINRRYGSKEAALQYLKQQPITVAEWRAADKQ
jgi:hypothetical protein